MSEELERISEFESRLADRRAERIERTRFGSALFVDSLPLVYYLNVLAVEPGSRPGAAELVEEVEAVQGAAGLKHRKVEVSDESLAVELEAGFVERGFESEPLLVMVHRGAGQPRGEAERVERVELEPAWAYEAPGGQTRDPEEIRQLVAAHELTERMIDTRFFACRVGGKVAAYCELYSEGGVGQIEGVITLEAFRERGLGTAVVGQALEESNRLGNDLHFLLADDNDWPKEWYRRMGFEEIGRTWSFLRKPAPGSPGR